MKVLVLGHGRHGKDTVGEILQEEYGFTFQSSSQAAAEIVVRPYLSALGIHYDSAEECYADRVNHRDHWYDAITEYNIQDRSRLCRRILKTSDMYVGMRNREELLVSRELFDIVLWVDAFDRCPPENVDSCTVLRSDADVIIDNSTTQIDLRRRVRALFETLTGGGHGRTSRQDNH